MATRVVSLTERALFFTPVLDWISPPNCEKLRIQSVGDSVLESLTRTDKNPYNNRLNTSYWHWATKPSKATARAFYTAFVTCLISPIGIIGYGAVTAKHLSSYAFYTYTGSGQAPAEWDKTKQYAKAFFTDTTSFILGATLTVMGVGSIILVLRFAGLTTLLYGVCRDTIATRIFYVFSGTLLVASSAWVLGAFTHESMIPQLIGWEDERVGMYLALELRNRLGLVNEDGVLLKFSSKDKLQYTETQQGLYGTSYTFRGAVYDQLINLVLNAELELLDKVREAQQICADAGKELISFRYPFNGNEVAKHLEKCFPLERVESERSGTGMVAQHPQTGSVFQLMDELRKLQYKVEVLKTIELTAKEVTLEDSIWMLFVKAMAKQPHRTINFRPIPSFVNYLYYQAQFNLRFIEGSDRSAQGGDAGQINLNYFTGLGLDPSTSAEPAADQLYDQFKYRVQTDKWRHQNAQPTHSAFWLLGLEDNCTYAQYVKAYRQYMLAVHPDKNGSSDESKQLTQIIGNIKSVLDRHFNR